MYNRWVSLILEKLMSNHVTSVSKGHSQHTEIRIFPNPANDLIELTFTGGRTEEFNILIYNAAGQVITELRSNGQSTIRHNTSAWAPGIYFYSVLTDKGKPLRGEFIIL
jgi:hypothetical protein